MAVGNRSTTPYNSEVPTQIEIEIEIEIEIKIHKNEVSF
jgi:hypothetical protein